MTEQVSEVSEIHFPDEMAKMSFDMLAGKINERNAEVGKINAVKGDRQTLTEQLEASSTNPDAVAARKARDEAQAALDEAIMALHKAVQPEVTSLLENAESSVKEIEEKVKELDGIIKPGTTYLRKSYGDDLAKALPPLARLKGFSTKGAGSSGRRIRGYSVAVTVDGEVTGFDNVAGAAKFLELDTAVLQEAFFKAAGDPEKLADAPNRVEFNIDYTETYEDDSTEQKTAKVLCEREAKDDAANESDDDE